MRKLVLMVVLVGCVDVDSGDEEWGPLVDLNGVACVLDVYPDSYTGVLVSYCRRLDESVCNEPTELRETDLHEVWDNCVADHQGACNDVILEGVRLWWVENPYVLVPRRGVAVFWEQWPPYWGYPLPAPDETPGLDGLCLDGDDAMRWVVVAAYKPGGARLGLARQMAVLLLGLPEGAELEAEAQRLAR